MTGPRQTVSKLQPKNDQRIEWPHNMHGQRYGRDQSLLQSTAWAYLPSNFGNHGIIERIV